MATFVKRISLGQHHLKRIVRVRFLRNGDANFKGLVMYVCPKNFMSFGKLLECVTERLGKLVPLCAPIVELYRTNGQSVKSMREFSNDECIICKCRYEKLVLPSERVEQDLPDFQRSSSLPSIVPPMTSSYSHSEVSNSSEGGVFLDIGRLEVLAARVMAHFEIRLCISRTRMSKLFVVKRKGKEHLFALKVVNKKQVAKLSTWPPQLEVKLLRGLQEHEHIVDLVMTCEVQRHIFIWCELMDCDLESYRENNKYISDVMVDRVYEKLAKGLQYIHSQNIVHRDIKPANILLRLQHEFLIHELKICDFGLSGIYEGKPLWDICGTPLYMAPEMAGDRGYDYKIDCWAAGVIIYTLVSARLPFADPTEILEKPYKLPTKVDTMLNAKLKYAIKQLLRKDPKQRFDADEMLQHAQQID